MTFLLCCLLCNNTFFSKTNPKQCTLTFSIKKPIIFSLFYNRSFILLFLLYIGQTDSSFNRNVGAPIPFIGTTLQSMNIMLNIVTHNIDVLHSASDDVGIRNELYHVFSFLLEWCTTSSNAMSSTNNKIKETSNIEILLEKTIILIGYYARGSAERQQSLHYGSHPTPLQKLCNLPFKFLA